MLSEAALEWHTETSLPTLGMKTPTTIKTTTMRNVRSALIAASSLMAMARVEGFAVMPKIATFRRPSVPSLNAATEQQQQQQQRRMGELTRPERTVYDLMHDVSKSGHAFRVVVVGKGAILETTVDRMGPVVDLIQSPSTGANLLTLASEDKTFEFHLQLPDVSKMVLVEKETPAKTMRIIRVLNATGESICSLILAEQSDDAIKWYHDLITKHGSDIQL
jgi:hypothetical protein